MTRLALENWLEQFKSADKLIAAKTLDELLFFNQSQIAANYRAALRSLDGWDSNPAKRKGRWFFTSLSQSSGKSGDAMLHHFRVTNYLSSKSDDHMFVHRSALVRQKLTADDTIVFVDDFSGTGSQVCEAWNDADIAYNEMLAGVGRIFLIVIAATKQAIKNIRDKTLITLVACNPLDDRHNVFHASCKKFTKTEKAKLLTYNKLADKKAPKGFGECGLLVVFQHRCPNNSIPILHNQSAAWSPLFPRFQ